MARVYIGVGSNIDPTVNVRAAVAALRERFAPLEVSPVYESRAVGFDGANFYNLVVGFDTDLPVEEVAAAMQAIEDAQGRDRSAPRFAPRTIDLDVLLYDDLVRDQPHLHLPRPEITENAFVLRPLAEITPERRHPTLGRTFAELWADYDEGGQPLRQVPFSW